jgi:hypothetical protein
VRRGGHIHELTYPELATWAFAHGSPDDEPGWNREALEGHMDGLGIPAPSSLVDGLAGRGLLAEVTPSAAAAAEFARAHRLVPTLYGLGNSPEDPGLYSIGLLGEELIRVSRPVFEIWVWGHRDGNLWRACETFATAEAAAGGAEPVLVEPAKVLAGFLGALHGLLNAQAAFLDVS